MRFLTLLLILPLALATNLAASPADLLAEAESLLLNDPPKALALGMEAVETLPADANVRWQNEDVTPGQLREQVEKLTAAYGATEDRSSYAAYCLAQLVGPDRTGLAVELARRHVRDGNVEAGLALAEEEELAGEARMRLLMALTDHFENQGDTSRMEETMAELLEIYPQLHQWVQGIVRVDLAERFVASGKFIEVVSLAHELRGWRQPYYLSQAAEVFPDWNTRALMDQALGLAQRTKPPERSLALVELGAHLVAGGHEERGELLIQSAQDVAKTLEGQEKVMAFASLAELSARRDREEEAMSHMESAIHTVMNEMEGWEQTDTLIELASRLAGTAAAPLAAPRIEEASALLSATAEEVVMRNKYRVFEFRGVAAAISPAEDYNNEERRELFSELIRLHAMPDAEEETETE